jgi:TIR domain
MKVFCSYSHQDEALLQELLTSIAGLRKQGLIDTWHDRQITPGHEWESAIYTNLDTADIVLVLVSPPLIASNFAFEKEMERALNRHEQGEALVIPIIVRPTDWKWSPLGKLQALPKDARAVTSWHDRDEAWLDVVNGIRRAIAEMISQPSEQEPSEATSARKRAEERRAPRTDRELSQGTVSTGDGENQTSATGESERVYLNSEELARKLNEWAHQRKLDDPFSQAQDIPNDMDSPEWKELSDKYDNHMDETERQYQREFLPEIARARAALASYGVKDSLFDRVYSRPRKYDDYRTVSEQLWEMSGELRKLS